MLSLEDKPASLLDLARNQLITALIQYKRKPYLPVWGELYAPLREIAKQAERGRENILIYPIEPSGALWYLYQERRFLADLPEPGITISLTREQLIDALMQGSFAPSQKKSQVIEPGRG